MVGLEAAVSGRDKDIHPEASLWEARHPPLGGESLRLSVGRIAVDLEGLDRDGVAALTPVYGGFIAADRDERAALRVSFARSPEERFLFLRPGEDHRVESRTRGERFHLWSYDFAGWFDPASREGLFLACPSDEAGFRRGVENYLRFLYSHLALGRGGFLLHAAGLVNEGEAHLFLGPDGSGKTSITEASAGFCEVLSDDLVLVVREGEGYALCGVPFFGTFVSGRSRDQVHPLHAAWYLQRGSATRAGPLPAGLQRAYLLAAVSFLGRSEEALAGALDATDAFLGQHEIGILAHRGDAEVWKAVAGTPRRR
jgi:hypothetical protein